MRRVVVTGMGLVTPLGSGVTHCWDRLIKSESGVVGIDKFDVSDLPAKIAAHVPTGDGPSDFDALKYISNKDTRRMDQFIIFALGAAVQAVEDSGWKPESEEEQDRSGVMIGSGIGGLQTIEMGAILVHEHGPRKLSPFFIPSSLINLASGHISIKYGFKGPNHSVVTACSTGAHAIGDASRLIMLDDADGMVAGGANVVCFTTGRGSVFGCRPTPSLKLATNSEMFGRMQEDMDINCGRIVDGDANVESLGQEIFERILRTASGEPSKSEAFGFGDEEFVPWQVGAIL